MTRVSVTRCSMARQLLDNIYGGKGACAYKINGAGASICVLEPRLIHAWALRDNISIWYVPGRAYLQSSFDCQIKALMNAIPCHQQ